MCNVIFQFPNLSLSSRNWGHSTDGTQPGTKHWHLFNDKTRDRWTSNCDNWQGRLFWEILNRGLDDDRLRGFENFVIKWIIIIKVILSIKSDFLFSKLLDHWLDVPVLRHRQEKVMHFLTGLDSPSEPPSPRPCQLGIEASIFHLTS